APGLGAEFETDILPIFKTHCYECHGPEKQKSGFRLDLRSAALRGGSESVAIVPGKPDESPLLEYVSLPNNDDLRMPPKGDGLSEAEVGALRKWVAGGAVWPDELAGEDPRLDHWAWQPISVSGERTKANSVDEFVRAKLKEKGLTMSATADRRTLIRRLSFDLHGMPPSPEAVKAFVQDPDPDAYKRLVEQLLDSPHYGERYARHWLDIAHYADTHGFERDKRRDSAWRYRDYVISALNADKPYDRFLREQIAGDVLWPNDEAATVATGFLAAGPWDFVGQVETKSPVLRRSARALDLDDITTQVMTSTMAMTVNCARCHDHKLDPISQEEYYQLTAVFAGVKRAERVTSQKRLTEYEATKAELTKQKNALAYRIGQLRGDGLDLADIVGGGNGHGSGTFGNGIDPRNAAVQTRKFGALGNVKTNHYAKSKFAFVDGVVIANGKDGAEIPVSSSGHSVSGIPTTGGGAWDHIRNGPVASQHSSKHGDIDFTLDGNTLLGIHANAGITFDLNKIRRATGETEMRFTSQVGYFGASGGNRADVWIFIDGQQAVTFKHLKRQDGLQVIDLALPGTAQFLTLLATDGGNGYSMDQVGFGNPKLIPAKPKALSEAGARELTRLRHESTSIDSKIAALGPPPKFYGVVAEKDMPEVRIQRRGNPEAEFGDPLSPGALSALAMLDPKLGDRNSSEKERRKALSEWITHPDNPLTARVIVNRLWHWHFGQGIVDTPSDFGLGGGRPSHPELLDWLAAELIRNKWSLKAIHRLILQSDAYRQISTFPVNDLRIAVDAGNRLVWRQNPRRIEAEAVRDTVLAVSGKLNRERGGPGFEDFKYTEAYAPIYEYVTADEPKVWRRSIYRYIVRTTPDQFLTTLDCPDPANFNPKRLTTTTPLQSLALYNNEFMLKQAQFLAERLEAEVGGDAGAQASRAFQYAFGRLPQREEAQLAEDVISQHGLFVLCRSLLNANEFVYVD
ncbi:MAG: DUF1553 domain-containing protein, partial [Verrucomicrobiales bacterium]|nr:DUF1553 domain-containing protein [Verrucomicrobiales bacterium]